MNFVNRFLPRDFPLVRLTGYFVLLGIATLLAVFAWMQNYRTQRAIEAIDQRIKTQNVLSPMVVSLKEQEKRLTALYHVRESLPEPAGLAELVKTVEDLAIAQGLTAVRVDPRAESILGAKKLEAQFVASGSTESIRLFLMKIADQKWIDHWEGVRLVVKGTTVEVSLRFYASYRGMRSK